MRTLSPVRSLSARVALCAALLAVGGCHSHPQEQQEPAAPAAVGFELPGNAPVAKGAILTQPAGREEPFVAFVAVGSSSWYQACRGEAGATPPLFTFATDGHGALRPPAADPGVTPRDRCLAARAAAAAAPAGLPADTRVTVQLALRAP
ncbi:MAG TPA: hypothetical protein VKZ18_02770 [Polyangia bacterium]|nr:hypothetical protein [Polyangia bacterium]